MRANTMRKKALIVGCTGQDGSYLAELLLDKGYEVHGTKRPSSSFNTARIDHLIDIPVFRLHYADVTDAKRMRDVMGEIRPDEVYNLAAQSHVGLSFDMPDYTWDSTAAGAANVLEACYKRCPGARIYQASSSEMFGNSTESSQGLATPLCPVSPYGEAKLYAHGLARKYRDRYQMHVSCGILFNHESPRRGETFVTRKITRAVASAISGRIRNSIRCRF